MKAEWRTLRTFRVKSRQKLQMRAGQRTKRKGRRVEERLPLDSSRMDAANPGKKEEVLTATEEVLWRFAEIWCGFP